MRSPRVLFDRSTGSGLKTTANQRTEHFLINQSELTEMIFQLQGWPAPAQCPASLKDSLFSPQLLAQGPGCWPGPLIGQLPPVCACAYSFSQLWLVRRQPSSVLIGRQLGGGRTLWGPSLERAERRAEDPHAALHGPSSFVIVGQAAQSWLHSPSLASGSQPSFSGPLSRRLECWRVWLIVVKWYQKLSHLCEEHPLLCSQLSCLAYNCSKSSLISSIVKTQSGPQRPGRCHKVPSPSSVRLLVTDKWRYKKIQGPHVWAWSEPGKSEIEILNRWETTSIR